MLDLLSWALAAVVVALPGFYLMVRNFTPRKPDAPKKAGKPDCSTGN